MTCRQTKRSYFGPDLRHQVGGYPRSLLRLATLQCRRILVATVRVGFALATLLAPEGAIAALDAASTAYRWQGGVFSVPFEVRDNSGVARRAWPVTTGVPLPYGVTQDASKLRLVDESGREVPSQIKELNRYFARDGSLRWVLLDFQVDLPAYGTAAVRLTNDRPAAPVTNSIRITEGPKQFTIDTGPLSATVGRKDASLLTTVTVNGMRVLESAPDVAPTLRTGETHTMEHHRGPQWNTHGWERQTTLEPIYVAEAEYRGRLLEDAKIETSGPLRTVLVARGDFMPTTSGRGILKDGLYRFTTRLTFYRGHSFVKVEHDLENSTRSQPQWNYMLREASLNYRPVLSGRATYTVGGWSGAPLAPVSGGGALSGGQEARLFQARPSRILRYGKSKPQDGGFTAGPARDGVVSPAVVSGARGRYLDISDNEKGVAITTRYLWEQGPRAIAVSGNRISIALQADAPGRSASGNEKRPEYEFDFGERYIHDVLLQFHAGTAQQARVADVAEAFEYPLFARAPPAWYADTETWYFEVSRTSVPRKPDSDKHWDPDTVGSRGYGENSGYNSGGLHDSQSSAWLPFIRSGALGELERVWAQSRWSISHSPGWDYVDNRLVLDATPQRYAHLDSALSEWNRLTGFGPKDFYLWKSDEPEEVKSARGEVRERLHGGWSYLNGYKILPDIEHYGLFRLFEYYNLTGDPRALDSIHGFVDWDVNFENRLMFGGKTPDLAVTDYFQKDPLALYRGHYSRIYAWMLFTTLVGFQTTGSEVFDMYTRWQIRRALELLVKRHGQFTSVPSTLFEQLKLAPVHDTSEVPFSVAKSWMEAIAVPVFHEAYKTYGDERILDAIWAQADYFSHHVVFFPRLGLLNSNTGMPNDVLSAGGDDERRTIDPVRHEWQTQMWPLLYYYTGWPDVAERLHASEATRSKMWTDFHYLQTIDWQAQVAAKRSRIPPDAVTDLRVVSADRAGIKLTWTSPKDDGPTGHAERYFVKISDKPIVEFAPTDDPSRDAEKQRIVKEVEAAVIANPKWNWRSPGPLKPGDVHGESSGARRPSPEWSRVNAFWMAEHVAGEPTPGPAGTTESFTIHELLPHGWFGAPRQPGLEILPRGTYYLALCSWDADHNLSRLSNVVSIKLN